MDPIRALKPNFIFNKVEINPIVLKYIHILQFLSGNVGSSFILVLDTPVGL